jgi:hypothetical protein
MEAVMSAANQETPAPAQSSAGKFWRTPHWQMALAVLVNALAIPMLIPAFLIEDWMMENLWDDFYFRYFVIPPVTGAFIANLFLLSMWLAIGGSPRRWRSLLISAIAAMGGLAAGLMLLLQRYLRSEFIEMEGIAEEFILDLIVPPVIAVVFVWALSVLFILPGWYFGITVDFQQVARTTAPPSRKFGVLQLFLWMMQLSIPLALAQLWGQLTEDQSFNVSSFFTFLMIWACCAPFAFSLLGGKISVKACILSVAWLALLLGGFSFTPESWQPSDTVAMLAFCAAIVVLNMLWLRYLGLRWLPHEPDRDRLIAEPTTPF